MIRVTVDDLFAGAGGWDWAIGGLGMDSRGVENDKHCLSTRRAVALQTVHDDVWTYEPDDTADGVVASPPCQPFSRGARRRPEALDELIGLVRDDSYTRLGSLRARTARMDPRAALVLLPLYHAVYGDYAWTAWEQVPGVLPLWEACAEEMATYFGWHTWTGLVHSEQYGVPQARTRAVLIASLEGPVSGPVPTHSRYYPRDPERLDPEVLPWVSMAEALDHRTDLPEWTHRRPSTTIVASFGADVAAAPGYRTTGGPSRQDAPESVRLTPEEAGMLQGFPSVYPWRGPKTAIYRQIGNAIPPPMAAAVVRAAARTETTRAGQDG